MEGDIKSALWTARNQAESLYPRKEDYRIPFGKKKKLVNLLSRLLLEIGARRKE